MRHRTVALIGGGHWGLDAGILQGLYRYAQPDKPWIIHDLARQNGDLSQLRRALALGAEVLVAHVVLPPLVRALQQTGLPVINLSHVVAPLPFCRIGVDNAAVGALAADYFLQRGYRSFGFVGQMKWAFARDRFNAFSRRLAESGSGPVARPPAGAANAVGTPHRQLVRWLRTLPPRTAVFALLDSVGRELCLAARAAGVRIPEDLAVLGCDNFELVCQLCTPQLSSVELPAERIGHRVGELLEGFFAGRALPGQPVLFAPSGVVTRRSTDAIVTSDPHVTAALRLMHDRVAQGLTLKAVLREVPVSRVQLFRLFRQHVGRSPLAELQRLRCDAAAQLLARTELPLTTVAQKSGFSSNIHLIRVFRRQTGKTPAAYRREHQGKG